METWTVRRMLNWMEGYLAEHGDAHPQASTRWLVSDALGLTRTELFMNYDRPLETHELDRLRDSVRRRAQGEPLQYITGTTFFRHVELAVRPGVLIPRPETEVLVSCVLAALPAADRPRAAAYQVFPEETDVAEGDVTSEDVEHSVDVDAVQRALLGEVQGVHAAGTAQSFPLTVVDLCTGSGCIACSLAYEHPAIRVIATDISPEACLLAAENAKRVGVQERIQVLECDLGAAVPRELMGAIDAVVANPPYIPTAVMAKLPQEVGSFEPELALHGGADGLAVFKRILTWAQDALRPCGLLAVELHETCLDAAAELASHGGFVAVSITEDLAGKPRVLVCHKEA